MGKFFQLFDSYLSATFSYFHFWMINLVNINGFSPNWVCTLKVWRSGLELLIGKFRQFVTELYAQDMSVFSFPEIT